MNQDLVLEGDFIDLSKADFASDLISTLGTQLENGNFNNKKLRINLGDLVLNDSQVFSLKSMAENINSEIIVIYTDSAQTQLSVLNAGLFLSDKETEKYCGCTSDEPRLTRQSCSKTVEETLEAEVDENDENLKQTLYRKQTLRSGQSVSYNGNVVIIGDCHAGSEITASGDITVWGVLNGIAHAGAKGDESAKIRALKINAIQLRIAGYFARKPDQIEVEKNEKIQSFIPEEAAISHGGIIIYTING